MEDIIANQTAALRRHLGLGEQDGMSSPDHPPKIAPLFFVELAPYAARNAKCKLGSCKDSIDTGEYRIALNPAMSGPAYHASKNFDFYHVACFEKIADLSKADFLDRISPVTRRTYHFRNLNAIDAFDGKYLCDGAVERLVLQWKVQRGEWIDNSEGKEVKVMKESALELHELLQKAGSSNFKGPGPISGITEHEYLLLFTTLAPYESDGPEDTEEWNLFDIFLSKDHDSWHDPHDLSRMLKTWERHRKLARYRDENLNEDEKKLKAKIGKKGIAAIRRLSTIPMPDIQGAFRGSQYIMPC